MKPKVSIILSTYNRPKALKQVLLAFNHQSFKPFEVIIADDGSGDETFKLLDEIKGSLKYPYCHVWQEDKGFRLSKSRNNGILKAVGEYIIFIDGDCIPVKAFIGTHLLLAEKGWFVRGSRVMLSQQLTQSVEAGIVNLLELSFMSFIRYYVQKKIKRISPLFKIPLGPLRKYKAGKWKGAKTCNMGVWKKDILSVNGFDEHYEGWGHEDADLVLRLFHAGVRRKEGLYAVPVFHLWHNENDRSQEAKNTERLHSVINSSVIKTNNGLIQHVTEK